MLVPQMRKRADRYFGVESHRQRSNFCPRQ
jgi:hypothetical protein